MTLRFNLYYFLHTESSYDEKWNIKKGLHAYFWNAWPLKLLWDDINLYGIKICSFDSLRNILNIIMHFKHIDCSHRIWESPCIKIWYNIQHTMVAILFFNYTHITLIILIMPFCQFVWERRRVPRWTVTNGWVSGLCPVLFQSVRLLRLERLMVFHLQWGKTR